MAKAIQCSFRHEKALHAQGCQFVAGIDEAGRGPLAGPVVAAIAILPRKFKHAVLRDSKQLSHRQLGSIYEELTSRADVLWAVAAVDSVEIDRINILRATHEAMRRTLPALANQSPQNKAPQNKAPQNPPSQNPGPDHVLIDGLPVPHFPLPHTALVSGDCLSYSIAAASVIAKVTRDRLMIAMDEVYPGYDFYRHKGYGTALHLERLKKHGPCPTHRRSFLPVAQTLFPFA